MRQRTLMTVLTVIVGVLGYIAYTNATIDYRPRPANYPAAVMRVLNAQGIDYRDAEVVDGCAPSFQNCRTYAGSVRVLSTTTLLGRIDCRERWINCRLTVPQAGIVDSPLDDTIDPVAARWEAFYGQLMLRLRQFYRGNLPQLSSLTPAHDAPIIVDGLT